MNHGISEPSMQGFGITVTAKMKHAALWSAAKRLSSQSALARGLKTGQVEVGRWCNLQACPPVTDEEVSKRRAWTLERRDKLEKALLKFTGQTLDELFPAALRENVRFLQSSKVRETTQQFDLEQLQVAFEERLTLPDPSVVVEQLENTGLLHTSIQNGLQGLTQRERKIIGLHFGLGGETHTLDEIAKVFQVTKERIRQIEARAIRRLRSSGWLDEELLQP